MNATQYLRCMEDGLNTDKVLTTHKKALTDYAMIMSKPEYHIINKRRRLGLDQTIQAGYYVSNAPYGYRKIQVDQKPTLELVEQEAFFVRLMYEMYINGHGCTAIARHVNAMGAKPRRVDSFTRATIGRILRNPTYMGKVVQDQKKHIKEEENPDRGMIYQRQAQRTVVDGLHRAIIKQEHFKQVQEIMDGRYIPASNDGTVRSPLAGLVKCGMCGKNMQRMCASARTSYLLCNTPSCCAGTQFELVEQAVICHLNELWSELILEHAMGGTHISSSIRAPIEAQLSTIRKALESTSGQKARLYELLELQDYNSFTFQERMEQIKKKVAKLESQELELQNTIMALDKADYPALARRVKCVLEGYDGSDAANRNAMLKSVIHSIYYWKEKKTKPEDFVLTFDTKAF